MRAPLSRSRSRSLGSAFGALILIGGTSSCCMFSEFGSALGRAVERFSTLAHSDIWFQTGPWSPDGSRLLVSPFHKDLFQFGLDGSAPKLLIAGAISSPSFSPDGRSIAYSATAVESEDGTDWGLWIASTDGSLCSEVISSREATWFTPAWSPDGRWIAYSGVDTVELVRPDLSERRRLGPGFLPVWSPDGKRLASLCVDVASDQAWIQLMQADGSGTERFTHGLGPSWSPRGDRLVFMDWTEKEEEPLAVFLIDANGANRHCLGRGAFPRWSPSGERILVQRFAEERWQLLTIAPDGSHERLLADRAFCGHWSPDGRRVAFYRGRKVFVIEADGSGERSLGCPPPRAGSGS